MTDNSRVVHVPDGLAGERLDAVLAKMFGVSRTRAVSLIADGTYGICESCGNPIGKGRAMAFPRATLCLTCKQREERR